MPSNGQSNGSADKMKPRNQRAFEEGRKVSPAMVSATDTGVEIRSVRVFGNAKTGRGAYIRVKRVVYTSEFLSFASELIGSNLLFHVIEPGYVGRAFLENGTEIGILYALGHRDLSRPAEELRLEMEKIRLPNPLCTDR